MNQETKAKGISLIVLVITIIIIIILAGAVILSLNSSNIIAKAKEAKISNDMVQIKEAIEAEKANAMLSGGTVNVTVPDAYKDDIYISPLGGIFLKPNANSKIIDVDNAMDKLGAAYMPTTGFEHVEGTINEGIVIRDITGTDTNGNEYVWVPVKGTLKAEELMIDEWLTNNYGDPFAKLFADDTTSEGYTIMKTSVEKYNGFYVSRYEAGTSTISTGSSLAVDGSLKPLSQKNKYVWNNIPWDSSGNYPGDDTQTGAALVSKMAYDGNTVVASSLLYGAQYDAMLNYINTTNTSVTNSTKWGNHSDSSITVSAGAKYSDNWGSSYTDVLTATTKPANTSWLLTTGASEQNKSKNIYDVAGNVWEWTYELIPAYGDRVVRSGNFNASGADVPAALCYNCFPGLSDGDYGFRFGLYIIE